MASSLALRRLLSANRFPKSFAISTIRPLAITRSPASKLFNTNALRSSDDDNNETDLNFDRRSGRHFSRRGHDFFSDVFVPFSPSPNLSHVLNLMDQISENPIHSATRGVGEAGLRLGWGARETEAALHLRFDMPGLGKEDVKVSVEHNNVLSIKGEGGKEDNVGEEEAPPRRYNTGIGLPEKMFKTDSIKAEMKNGVLKVVVPKLKEEERADVLHVKVE
ncbi:23.6 kDa heat shock protein, mitochondrial-like [Malus sylvestris]|uniref:23.6 kDa heat shock protein, mitochondrial-like n=1 Tax=Malus sylvestris TaxID=3752 RepID=UPI0021ABFF5E|nr:23.6 kDa heat shock protein, mitochondrial-like [Malus sylvestris]